ncbi:MAG: hypothetical protein ACT4OM_05130 [Actinomycetota bacterium]
MNDKEKADWTLVRGVPEDLPSVEAVYEVVSVGTGKVNTTLRVARGDGAEKRKNFIVRHLSELQRSLLKEPETREWGSMHFIVYADGDGQTTFSPATPGQSQIREIELVTNALSKLPSSVVIDPQIPTMQRGKEAP